MTARILAVEPHEYHRLPGFSASLAKVLIGSCALKAKDAYDRMLERIAEEDEDEGDDDEGVTEQKRRQLEQGNIYHALVLGKGKRVSVIPAALMGKGNKYSTNASKDARDSARESGRIPVKESDVALHERVAGQIAARINGAGHTLDGISELAVEWSEPTPHGPVQCRAMLDHVVMLDQRAAIIYDLKIVGDAHPDRCERTAESLGYAIQAAAYKRALNALYPTLAGRVDFRFLFCEPKRPYGFWDPGCSGVFAELGERRWLRAVHAWGEGLATGRWPDYRTPDRVEITAPMWTLRAEGFTPEEM